MKKIQPVLLLLCFTGLLFLENCSKKADPVPFKVDAGPNQTATTFATVTLDASASTGPGPLVYQWQLIGWPGASVLTESDIQFQNATTAKPTFVPPKNGLYTFRFQLFASGGQFGEAQVTVTVSGVLTLSGTLSSNLILKDIEPDGTKPDYILSADLIIPAGVQVTAAGTIVIDAADNTGILIQGGSLVTTGGSSSGLSYINFTSTPGWKGILLSSGSLSLVTSQIIKGGKSTFAGQTETAAIVVTGGTISLTANTNFTGSTGYDVLISSVAAGSTIAGCSFSALKPIKAPIANLSLVTFNNFGTYNYIVLSTPGAGTTVGSSTGNFTFLAGTKFYIDGDFTAGSPLIFSGNTIYMKPGAGIVASAGITASTTTFDGHDGVNAGAAWKGIAIGNSGNTPFFNTSFVKNAGSAVFSTGSFTTLQKAAIYYYATANGTLSNTEISGSGGYGVIVDTPPGNYLIITANAFKNNTLAHISAPVTIIHQIFGGSATTANTFTGVSTAVEIPSFGSTTTPIGVWASLGSSTNVYQFLSSVNHSSSTWTLSPGVNLRFKSGKQLDHTGGTLSAIGLSTNPITFDSDTGTAASWIGIGLEAGFDVEFCTIMNGGQSEVFKGGATPATLKANVVFNSTSGTTFFKNNTISGGGGYGTLIESGKLDPQPLLAGNANTYSSNTSGTNLKQP